MKKKISVLIAFVSTIALTASLMAAYTAKADDALGIWLVPKGDAKVTIMKCGANFCGKVTWLKSPDDLDTKNPDPEKQKLKILGMNMLWGFIFKNNEWVGGQIYDPDSGNTYKCKMWLISADKLNVKGFVGIPLFGRSEVWTRVK
jgi:uncharacterized protein (DUF2147 family)